MTSHRELRLQNSKRSRPAPCVQYPGVMRHLGTAALVVLLITGLTIAGALIADPALAVKLGADLPVSGGY